MNKLLLVWIISTWVLTLQLSLKFHDYLEEYREQHPPFGDVSEILLPSRERRMYEYYKELCKMYFDQQFLDRYMNCAEEKMVQYLGDEALRIPEGTEGIREGQRRTDI